MEHWGNGAERENPKQLEKIVFQCCSIHRKFHMECTGHENWASIIYATFHPNHFFLAINIYQITYVIGS